MPPVPRPVSFAQVPGAFFRVGVYSLALLVVPVVTAAAVRQVGRQLSAEAAFLERVIRDIVVAEALDPVTRKDGIAMMAMRIGGVHAVGELPKVDFVQVGFEQRVFVVGALQPQRGGRIAEHLLVRERDRHHLRGAVHDLRHAASAHAVPAERARVPAAGHGAHDAAVLGERDDRLAARRANGGTLRRAAADHDRRSLRAWAAARQQLALARLVVFADKL